MYLYWKKKKLVYIIIFILVYISRFLVQQYVGFLLQFGKYIYFMYEYILLLGRWFFFSNA